MSIIILSIIPIGIISPFIGNRIKRGPESHHSQTEPFILNTTFGVAGLNAENDTSEYQLYQNLSISATRRDFSWDELEQSSGVFNFSRYDDFLDNMDAINISVLGLLDFDNNLIETQTNETGTDKYIAPEDVPLFLNYVNETLYRFQHRVIAWEIWNEANYKVFWPGSQEDFFYLFNKTINFVNQYYPNITLLSTSVIDIGLGYFEDMFKAGLLQQCDGISFHAYSTYDEAIIYKIWQLQDLCRTYDYDGDLWLTETGNPTGGNYMHATTEEELGNRLIRTITLCTSLGIDHIFWYTFNDGGPHSDVENSEAFFGLVCYDESLKSGANAYKFFVEECIGLRYSPDCITLIGGSSRKNLFHFLYRQPTGESVLIMWYRSDMVHDENIRVKLNLNEDPGSVQFMDFVTGEYHAFIDREVKIGYRPLILVFDASEAESLVEIRVFPSRLVVFLILLMSISIASIILLNLNQQYGIFIKIKQIYADIRLKKKKRNNLLLKE